jgi:hypothetical protein
MGRSFSGTIEDQQLLLDEHGFGDHGTRAAGTGQSGDRREQMQEQDDQIAHGTILLDREFLRNAHESANRRAQADQRPRRSVMLTARRP